MVGDPSQHVGEPSLRSNPRQPGGLDQREHDRRAVPVRVRVAEGPVAVTDGDVFVEELLFRGVVQTSLAKWLRPSLAILSATVLFVLSHVPGWLLLNIPIDAYSSEQCLA